MTANPWDERYAGADYRYGTTPNDFLEAEAHRLPPAADVLCLADGEGRNGVFLAGLGHRVTAVDGSAVGLKKASKLAASRGLPLTVVAADLADFDLGEGSWDGVISIWCHLPSALRAQVHRGVVRGLRPGGWLILEAYTPAQIGRGTGGPPDVDMTMTPAALRAELAGLEVVLLEEKVRDVREGAGHGGPGAVVQLLARKPA